MSFGKRGVQSGSISRPAFATAAPVSPTVNVDDEPGLLGGLLGGKRSVDFDLDLSHLQSYGQDKSVIFVVVLWLFLGGLGGHRFYLGNWIIAGVMCIMGIVSFIIYTISANALSQSLAAGNTGPDVPAIWFWLTGSAVLISLWCFIDGIYVICRMLSARVGS